MYVVQSSWFGILGSAVHPVHEPAFGLFRNTRGRHGNFHPPNYTIQSTTEYFKGLLAHRRVQNGNLTTKSS
jgi:hypothetical protein